MALDSVLAELSLPEVVQPYVTSLNTEISAEDGMYQRNPHHYFSCGASALACILQILGLSGMGNPKSMLDFGCGAGRVTRWMRAAYADAVIHACDIREVDVKFVNRSCRATTWVSGVDIDALTPPGSYDLIWVGSVFTHLSGDVSKSLLAKLMGWLNPNGLLIFSVHGRFVLYRADTGDNIYGLGAGWEKLKLGYDTTGYGYADYPFQTGYGISVSKSTWWTTLIESHAGMRMVCLAERVWDRHHDVIAVQNSGWG